MAYWYIDDSQWTALSVRGNTKASLSSFNTYVFHTGTSFLKIIDEESK